MTCASVRSRLSEWLEGDLEPAAARAVGAHFAVCRACSRRVGELRAGLDSTHIISNIRTRGRLALFTNTLSVFLKSLSQDQFSRVPKAIRKWHKAEPEGWFGLGPAEHKVKLEQLAQYAYKLIVRFATDDQIKSTEPYQLLERLIREQCEIRKKPGSDGDSSKDNDVQVKKKTEGPTLQSPYDPDASYGQRLRVQPPHYRDLQQRPKDRDHHRL